VGDIFPQKPPTPNPKVVEKKTQKTKPA